VPIRKEDRWASEPVWMLWRKEKSLALAEITCILLIIMYVTHLVTIQTFDIIYDR
jgi:hypothetical protein